MNIENLFAVIVMSFLSSGIGVFLLKKWIEHSFEARLVDIEAKNRISAYEHQVRFTRFDEQVASAIESSYEIVCEYSDAVRDVTQNAYSEDEDATKGSLARAEDVARRFDKHMRRQTIYLSADMAVKLRETRLALRDALRNEMSEYHAHKNRDDKPLSVLVGVYKNAGLQAKLDDLMADLQQMVREHLSHFVSTK